MIRASLDLSTISCPPSVENVDLYGKRRQAARVQVLEREIGLLQDEIKSLGRIELASTSCKELHEFINATPDPFTAISPVRGRCENILKILGRIFSCLSWTCCFCGTCCSSATCRNMSDCCCCDVKKTCRWRPCSWCKISFCCNFDLSCQKCLIRCGSTKACCNRCLCF